MTNTLPVTQTIINAFQSFVLVDGNVGTTLTNTPSNAKLVTTAGANGSIVKSFTVNMDDTVRVLVIYISPDAGTTKWPIGTASIATNSGATGAIVNVDLLNSTVLTGFPVDQAGRNIIELAATYRIYAGVQTTLTTAKFMNLIVMQEDF